MAPEANTPVLEEVAVPVAAANPNFLNQVSSLPLVNSALDIAKTFYDGTKTRYSVVERVEKELVGNIVPQVISATTKVTPPGAQAILSKGLSQLDQYACTGLEVLERNVPLIKEHPSQILESGKKLVDSRIISPVTDSVKAVDQLVERVLLLSEEQVEALLPEDKSAPEEHELHEIPAASEEAPAADAPAKRKSHFLRVQDLGVSISKRLSRRAFQQLQGLKQRSPQEIQKIITVDLIHYATSTAEKQALWAKENFDSLVRGINSESASKLFETYLAELRTSFAAIIDRAEKMTPASVKETTHALFHSLSVTVLDFSDKLRKALSQLPLSHPSLEDPNLKKLLETLQGSVAFLSTYADTLRHLPLPFAAKAPTPAATEEKKPEEPEALPKL